MIDSYTKVIYGWKLTSTQVGKIQDELSNIDPDYIELLDGFIVEDTMCGTYFYFGAILGSFDNDDDNKEVVVTTKLAKQATDKYNIFLKEHADVSKVFNKYSKKAPQLYVVLHKW